MLSSIRKFSKTIYAKLILAIVAIPFIFWGMGSSFSGGSQNVVVKIDKEKFSTKELADFIQSFASLDQKITSDDVERLLSNFIAEKLIEKEYKKFNIHLSDNSLSKLIKNQKEFKKDNIFSRTEYEKFLIVNNVNAVIFESSLAKGEKKKQLLDLIGGGVVPSKFLVNRAYNNINKKINIELINLNEVFVKDFKFSNNEIESYYNNNKDNFKEIYKSVKILDINPEKLTGKNEFNDLFFKKIDEIDDAIVQGKKLNFITNEYNLDQGNIFTTDKSGKDINSKLITILNKNLIDNIFLLNNSETTILVESENKFFIIELVKTEEILKSLEDENVKKIIKQKIELNMKRKFISQLMASINQNNFKKSDFDKLSNEKKIEAKKIILNNRNDTIVVKKELLNQIYSLPEKKIAVLNDIGLTENFLIYIDKIENVYIEKNSEEYAKYFSLSKSIITNELFNTYDTYLKEKYKIDINYKALKTVKNYFN